MKSENIAGLILAALIGWAIAGCGDDDVKWERVAECSTGPAWHIGDELICDDFRQTSFAAREWRPDDNAETACAFCEGFIQ